MLIVFSDDTKGKTSLNAKEIERITEAARLFGCRVFVIPSDFSECKTAENALAYVPEFDERALAVWVGFIPTYERYEAIYQAALTRNIQLVNSPQQYRLAMEFDQFYPLIEDVTPRSLMIESLDELQKVPTEIEFPVFVKGTVKSNKEDGWEAVVAQKMDDLKGIASKILKRPHRSRGKVIVRELVQLKQLATDPNGFPISREYRAFAYRGELLKYGFYWDEYEDHGISAREIQIAIEHLVSKVTKAVDVPFLSIDIAQLAASDEWIVIELGDGQFTGLSQIPVLELWSKIKDFKL